jgi:carbon monoxide dehydrogenase subunit G
MAFEIARTFVIKAPPAQVWDFLTDPESGAVSARRGHHRTDR